MNVTINHATPNAIAPLSRFFGHEWEGLWVEVSWRDDGEGPTKNEIGMIVQTNSGFELMHAEGNRIFGAHEDPDKIDVIRTFQAQLTLTEVTDFRERHGSLT
jgi:hypothetical protein